MTQPSDFARCVGAAAMKVARVDAQFARSVLPEFACAKSAAAKKGAPFVDELEAMECVVFLSSGPGEKRWRGMCREDAEEWLGGRLDKGCLDDSGRNAAALAFLGRGFIAWAALNLDVDLRKLEHDHSAPKWALLGKLAAALGDEVDALCKEERA